MDERGDELQELRARAARDERVIENLRAEVARGDVRDSALAALVGRLRDEAGARDAELATVQAQLAASEVELGDLRAVRDALTPAELPDRPGLELAVSFLPATRGVSGDFYLVAPGPQETTLIVLGDVVGKGIEAARDAAFLRTAFATIARFSDDPCRLLEWADVAFSERVQWTGKFATALCLTYDPGPRRLRWAVAGHPAPLWLGSGEELSLHQRRTPLGVASHGTCREGSRELAAGDGVLLYTDGLTEARRDQRLFGVERVQELLRTLPGRPAAELLTTLGDDAAAYGGGRLADDLCLLAVTAAR